MKDWTSGYVADIGYTFGYYAELNPLRSNLALLNHGIVTPKFESACELGFGQGLSTNIHAAASNVEWFGTDFNPAQAGFAQELTAASGCNNQFLDEAFEEYCNRSDLPDFDFIGLHGIWSWISDENRAVIADFVRRKLKVGGVLYISYNTLPGWAAFAPLRHLMTEHAEIIGAEGRGLVSRINDAIEFADQLLQTNPIYHRANPLVVDRIKKLKEQNADYLAHEYFNRDWHPMHFATMGRWLDKAKVNFACSASYLDHVDTLNLTADQQKFLADIPDPMFRESTRDFMVNQQFRRDYWVKGARKMNRLEQLENLRKQTLVLTSYRPEIKLKVTGALGEAEMSERVYAPILDVMADYKERTIGELEQEIATQKIEFGELMQAVMLLSGAGHLNSVQESSAVKHAASTTKNLNLALADKARGSSNIGYLASSKTGGGLPANRFEQLFLLAKSKGAGSSDEYADFAFDILAAQGQKILKEGKVIESDEEARAEMRAQAAGFAEKRLPILKGAGVL